MKKQDNKEIFISIIIPVFRVEKYLRQCIDSVMGQSFDNFELILVDDGSPDNCPIICDEFAKKDSRIKVIHQKNGGQTKARKAGLIASRGKYIFFVDGDDWLETKALEIIHKNIIKSDADIITFGTYFNYSGRRTKVNQLFSSGCLDKKDLIERIYPKMIYSGKFFYFGIYAAMWNKVFRRSIVLPNIINVDDRIKIGEDGVTTFATFLDAQRVCILKNDFLYNYRDNNISITRSYCRDQFDSVLLLIHSLEEISTKKSIYDLSEQINYYFMYNIYSIFIEEFYYKYNKNYIERYKYLYKIANNSAVKKACKNILTNNMERKYKLFFKFLQNGKFNKLIVITIWIAHYKRIKILLKKLLNYY